MLQSKSHTEWVSWPYGGMPGSVSEGPKAAEHSSNVTRLCIGSAPRLGGGIEMGVSSLLGLCRRKRTPCRVKGAVEGSGRRL